MMHPDREKKLVPGKLWSLLDMLELHLRPLAEGIDALGRISLHLDGMQSSGLSQESFKRDIIPTLERIREAACLVDDGVSVGTCNKILATNFPSKDHGIDLGELRGDLNYLRRTVIDFLGSKTAFLVDAKYISQYRDGAGFGASFEERFPNAIADSDDAAKALALGLYTACIFHLMRAMESTLDVLGDELGVKVKSDNGEQLPWGVILSNLKDKIDTLEKGIYKDNWYKVHALLHSVNRGFRTKTAHPGMRYTEEEAQNTMNAVKGYMAELTTVIS